MQAKEILEFIKSKADYLKTAADLTDIYNRNLYPHLEARLQKDLQSEAAAREAMSRVSTVNILPKVVDKLSGVYKSAVTRTSGMQSTVDELTNSLKITRVMMDANRYLNLHRCVAIEPVFTDSVLTKLRVIPADKFLVMDDGTIDGNITAFIKVMSEDSFQVYTPEQFFMLDINGGVTEVQENTFGFIPVVYIKRDCLTVMPPEDKDTIKMVTLLPLLLTDMNYALKFQCFSIVYTIDCDIKNMQLAPNAVWPLKASEGYGENAKPSIGTIEPKVAVSDILDALFTQYSMWFESRNLKLQSIERGAGGDSLSGIAKLLDNSDVDADIDYQKEIFAEAEAQLFTLIAQLKGGATSDVVVSFPKNQVIPEAPTEKVDRLVKEVNAGFTTKRMAVRAIHPSLTEEEVNDVLLNAKQEEEVPNGLGDRDNADSEDEPSEDQA